MSLEYLTLAFKTKVGNPMRKLVLLKLADNANDEGYCWPSIDRIAEQTEVSRNTVIAHIKGLAEMGLVTVIRRKGDGGVDLPNHYQLNRHQFWGGSATPGGGRVQLLGGEGATARLEPIKDNHHTEPSLKPNANLVAEDLISAGVAGDFEQEQGEEVYNRRVEAEGFALGAELSHPKGLQTGSANPQQEEQAREQIHPVSLQSPLANSPVVDSGVGGGPGFLPPQPQRSEVSGVVEIPPSGQQSGKTKRWKQLRGWADEVAAALPGDTDLWDRTKQLGKRKGVKEVDHWQWAAMSLHPELQRLGQERFIKAVEAAVIAVEKWPEAQSPLSMVAKKVGEWKPTAAPKGQNQWGLEEGFLERLEEE